MIGNKIGPIFYVPFLGLCVVLLSFQNCSKVDLETSQESVSSKTHGEFCLDETGEVENPHRVIFFIDNSESMRGIDHVAGGYPQRAIALRDFVEANRKNDNLMISIGTLHDRQAGFLPDLAFPEAPTLATPQGTCQFYKPRVDSDYEVLQKAMSQLEGHAQGSVNNTPFMAIFERVESCLEMYVNAEDTYQYSIVIVTDGAPTDVTASEISERISSLVALGGDGIGFSMSRINFFFLFLDDYNANPDASYLISEGIEAARRSGGLRSRAIALNNQESYNYRDLGLIEKSQFRVKQVIVTNLNSAIHDDGLQVVDSDGDGLPDDEELKYGLDPYDYSSNGFCSDLVYVRNGFKCPSACSSGLRYVDSDYDGLSDCDETMIGTHPYQMDTDLDGIPDGLEYRLGLSPLDPTDRNGDPDSDGIINFDEALRNTSPFKNDVGVSHPGFINVNINEKRNVGGSYCYKIRLENIRIYPKKSVSRSLNYLRSVDGENIVRILLQVVPSDKPSARPRHRVAFKSFNYQDSHNGVISNYTSFSSDDFEKVDED